MSYQALARKYRPRSFDEIVGQEHVVQALSNAFRQDRIHHALLFSGTRGVGKTTLARVIAKCLNDESGVTATPDLNSDVSQSIDAGRFVDLIEVDAASRTGVDDTREMLENVQYAPTQGRYKVYLIDEVHMFSKHSFNALLKTLEEPPPHVQFLLATTDPQKLPVTILSRCLQFHLRRLTVEEIAGQLASILDKEGIAAEAGGLNAIAIAADGSMRDALSLLDQAIGYGSGQVEEKQVREMLGIIDHRDVLTLIEGLAANDGKRVMQAATALEQKVPDYDAVLADMATMLQQIAVRQVVSDAPQLAGMPAELAELAGLMSPEAAQLNYEIACTTRRDLDWAPSHRLGFEMGLLRMLAFAPQATNAGAGNDNSGRTVPVAAAADRAPPKHATANAVREPAPQAKTAPAESERPVHIDSVTPQNWQVVTEQLDLPPAARELARNCVLETAPDNRLILCLPPSLEHLLTDRVKKRVIEALELQARRPGQVSIELREGQGEAPAQVQARDESQRQQAARAAIDNDPTVQELQKRFGAQVDPESIRPVTNQ